VASDGYQIHLGQILFKKKFYERFSINLPGAGFKKGPFWKKAPVIENRIGLIEFNFC